MRILVVDDEFVSLTKMTAMLAEYGECDAGTNGSQGLDLFTKAITLGKPYELITIDIEMPDINGLSLLATFIQNERRANVKPSKKIMISAASSLTNVKRAIVNGADSFLVKPVKKQILAAKIQEVMFAAKMTVQG